MKSIIHDYEDERAVAILRICRRAMVADATPLLIERIVGPPNEDPRAKFSDLIMLVAPAGKERTLDEWWRAPGSVLRRPHPAPPVSP